MTRFRLAVLPGDGIGPEVVGEAVKVLRAVEAAREHHFELTEDDVGGAAIDAYGTAIRKETIVRANYKSYGAPKPYFIFEDGEWRHKNRPVPRLVASHGQEPLYRVAMAHLLSVHIFMQRFFFDWWFSNGRAVYEAASEVSGKSSCYLLERLQERLAAEHIPAMIVVQYPGHSYIRRRPRPDYVEDVLRCARELGYEVVDERDPMSAIARQSIASLQEHYVMSPEGGYGHMSARGNQLIASLIADRLFRLGDRATIARPVP